MLFQVDQVLGVLENDLRNRGVLGDTESVPDILDFALLLIDEYIRYPIGNEDATWFPYNYCMLHHQTKNPFVKSALKSLLNLFCA